MNKLAEWKTGAEYCPECGESIAEAGLNGFSIICANCGRIS